LGAAAPEIFRITKTADVSLVHAHPYLIFMSVLYIAVGGFFAVAWEDEWALKSIYIGTTFPIWISTWTHMVIH
jgi:hypothetical protein